MSISESLTQQQLQEILLDICKKGNEAENIDMKELVEDMKQRILQSEYSKQTGVVKIEAAL